MLNPMPGPSARGALTESSLMCMAPIFVHRPDFAGKKFLQDCPILDSAMAFRAIKWRWRRERAKFAGIQGWAGRNSSSRRFVSTCGTSFPRYAQRNRGILVRLQAKICAPQFAGLLLLVAGILSYQVRELLICWLLFAALFASMALAILSSVLAWHAAKYSIHWSIRWARTALPIIHAHVNAAKVRELLFGFRRRVFSS